MNVTFDPKDESNYRRILAEEYLKYAIQSFKRGDYPTSVHQAQLSAENAAKAIISLFETPTWSHNPAPQLKGLTSRLPNKEALLQKLAEIVEDLAPEHARSTYGEPKLMKTPWEIYTKEEAKQILEKAEKALQIMKKILA